jgi:hypothetical protein
MPLALQLDSSQSYFIMFIGVFSFTDDENCKRSKSLLVCFWGNDEIDDNVDQLLLPKISSDAKSDHKTSLLIILDDDLGP